MSPTDLHTLKTVAKNLAKSLKEIDYDPHKGLSHSASLNLAARGFGFENYNAAKAILSKEPSAITGQEQDPNEEYKKALHAIQAVGINEEDANELMVWYVQYLGYGQKKFHDTITSYIHEVKGRNIFSIDSFYAELFYLVLSDLQYFVPVRAQWIYSHYLIEEQKESEAIIRALKTGNFIDDVLAKSLRISTKELETAFSLYQMAGIELDETARVEFISSSKEKKRIYTYLSTIYDVMQSNAIMREDISNILQIDVKKVEKHLSMWKELDFDLVINGIHATPVPILEDYGQYSDGSYGFGFHRLFSRRVMRGGIAIS